MIPEKAYPKFSENQVLTHKQLNTAVDYLEEQDRWSRIVVGSGILCGLKVSFDGIDEDQNKVIILSKGAGWTSSGYLILNDEDRIYTHYKELILPESECKKSNYLYSDDADEETKIPLYELIENGEDSETQGAKKIEDEITVGSGELPINIQEKMAVILHLEIACADLAVCKIDSCDNEGEQTQLRWRALLIRKTDLDKLLKKYLGQVVNIDEYFTSKYKVHEVRVPVPRFTCINTKSYIQIYMNYLYICKMVVNDLISAFGKSETAYARYIDEFNFEVDDKLNSNLDYYDAFKNVNGIQYLYDHLKDVAMALNEFNDAAFAYHCDCSLNQKRYPRYLMAGSFVDSSEQDDIYRHYFEPCCRDLASTNKKRELINLYKRVNAIINCYDPGFINDNGDADIDENDRLFITAESRSSGKLADLAVPYYYKEKDEDQTELRRRWNPHKFARGHGLDTPFYWDRDTAGPASWMQDPNSSLRFRLDRHDCFHIEGHLGMTVKEFNDAFDKLKERFEFPFDVKKLEAKQIGDCKYEQPYANLCELEILYELEQKEILCFLGKLFDYFKRFDIEYIYTMQPAYIDQSSGGLGPGPVTDSNYGPNYIEDLNATDPNSVADSNNTTGPSTSDPNTPGPNTVGPSNVAGSNETGFVLGGPVPAAHQPSPVMIKSPIYSEAMVEIVGMIKAESSLVLRKKLVENVAVILGEVFKSSTKENQWNFPFLYTEIEVDGQIRRYIKPSEAFLDLFLSSNMWLHAFSSLFESIFNVKSAIEEDQIDFLTADSIETMVTELMENSRKIVSSIEESQDDLDFSAFGTSIQARTYATLPKQSTRGLPQGWSSVDIGTTGGNAYVKNGIWTVRGKGASTVKSDSLHFVYLMMRGNVEIVACVTDFDMESNNKSMVGIMIRKTLDPGSMHVTNVITRDFSSTPNDKPVAAFVFRKAKDSSAFSDNIDVEDSPPYWLKLKREGTRITSFLSVDGITWKEHTSIDIEMGSNFYVGLCVSSSRPNTMGSANFNNVSPSGTIVGPQKASNPQPPDGAVGVVTSTSLSWTAGFGAKLHFVNFGDNFDDVSNATGGDSQGIAEYDPNLLEPGKKYYWRVDEFDGVVTHEGDIWSFTTKGVESPPDKCVILALLISIYSRCWARQFLEIKRKYQEKNVLEEEITFPQYVYKHPGIEHIGGVPKGGTFIVVYKKNQETLNYPKELPSPIEVENYIGFVTNTLGENAKIGYVDMGDESNEIVADFCLPYLCCSDTTSIKHIVFAELKIDIPPKICECGEICKPYDVYKIKYLPVNAKLYYVKLGDELEELQKDEAGHYYIGTESDWWELGHHNITISLANKSVNYSYKIVKHPKAAYEPGDSGSDENGNFWLFNPVPSTPNDDWSYTWYVKDSKRNIIDIVNAPTYKHTWPENQKPVPFFLELVVSIGECKESYEHEKPWSHGGEVGFLRRIFGDHA